MLQSSICNSSLYNVSPFLRIYRYCLYSQQNYFLNYSFVSQQFYGISSNWMRAMCESLTNNRAVTCLDLTDNWLTTDACFHLGDLILKNKFITSICLYGCNIGPEGVRRLVEGFKKTTKLVEVDLSYNNIGDEGMIILAPAMEESIIKKLNLSHNNLKIIAGQEFGKAIEENKSIIDLDLSWNFMENKGMIPVLKSLKSNPISRLNISWNGLTDVKMEKFLLGIVKKSSITYLDISNNLLKGELLMIVSYYLFKPKKLEVLKIGNNQLTSQDAIQILYNFENRRVKCNLLDMSSTNVTKAFLEELEVMKMIPARKNAQVIYGNVIGNYEIIGPDQKEIGFKRAKFVAEKKKKDFGEFILRLYAKLRKKKPKADEFATFAQMDGIVLDNDLMVYVCEPFTNKKKKLDVEGMARYVKELWPETRLVLKPAGETEAANPKDKGKGKKK